MCVGLIEVIEGIVRGEPAAEGGLRVPRSAAEDGLLETSVTIGLRPSPSLIFMF